MILDNFAFLHGTVSAAGVLAGAAANGAGNVLSTNTMDLGPLTIGGNQVGDVGAGEALEISISVTSQPTVGTNVQFQLIQADDAALTTNVQVINQTDAFTIAQLPVGTVIPLHYDRAAPFAPKRYIGVRFVNTGAIATAAYVAAVVKNVQDLKNIYFKSGFVVS